MAVHGPRAPVQTSTLPVLIHRQLLGVDQFFFEASSVVVIELQAARFSAR